MKFTKCYIFVLLESAILYTLQQATCIKHLLMQMNRHNHYLEHKIGSVYLANVNIFQNPLRETHLRFHVFTLL